MSNNYALDALDDFMQCWKVGNWAEALCYCQKTWVFPQIGEGELWQSTKNLKELFHDKKLVKYQITNDCNVISTVCMEITVCFTYEAGDYNKTYTIPVKLIREKAPYTPSETGEWGVNPLSIIRSINTKEAYESIGGISQCPKSII